MFWFTPGVWGGALLSPLDTVTWPALGSLASFLALEPSWEAEGWGFWRGGFGVDEGGFM